MEHEKTFSIIIPTKDRPGFLLKLLKSLRELDYLSNPKIEILVIGNGSENKKNREICLEFKVEYFLEGKLGRSSAINKGIRISSGDYLAFLDDDIILQSKEWLKKLNSHFSDVLVGYVSGNVLAANTTNYAEKIWEKKGGLSKGKITKVYGFDWFNKFRMVGVPIRLIAAGTNCMIPRHVLNEIGLFDERFGTGCSIPHGESLDICYRILRKGYYAIYDPNAILYHYHPQKMIELRKKMYKYGIGDTAIHMKFFIEYGDVRGLFEAIWGRNLTLIMRLILSVLGNYPLPPGLLVASLCGSIYGPICFFKNFKQ